MDNTFPFEVQDENNCVIVDLESSELYLTYFDLFTKYEYEGNGYCWEGHIEQIIEKKGPELLGELEFDSEAGMFCVFISNKEIMNNFLSIVVPIFSDLKKLETYIKVADRELIDD